MFTSPQVKRSGTIINKDRPYILLNKLPNDLTLYQENVKTTDNYSLVPSPPPKTDMLLMIIKKRIRFKLETEF